MVQLMEIGFSRSSVEMAFKTLGMSVPVLIIVYICINNCVKWITGGERDSSIESVINWLLENPESSTGNVNEFVETIDSSFPEGNIIKLID